MNWRTFGITGNVSRQVCFDEHSKEWLVRNVVGNKSMPPNPISDSTGELYELHANEFERIATINKGNINA